jgi:hypothetical protein
VINVDSIRVQTIVVNQPLKPEMIVRGESIFLEEDNPTGQNLHDKIVFTLQSNHTLSLKGCSDYRTLG